MLLVLGVSLVWAFLLLMVLELGTDLREGVRLNLPTNMMYTYEEMTRLARDYAGSKYLKLP